ncbi:MAG: TlpA disulfide reductase family protein [Planctomycetota bacterium]
MPLNRLYPILICVCTILVGMLPSQAQESPPTQVQSAAPDNLPDLSIPAGGNLQQVKAVVKKAKAIQPKNGNQYKAMQTAIRDGSERILSLLQNDKDSADYRQAELDTITASVSLMAFGSPDAQKKTLEQIQSFLKSRKTLSLQDVQTGIMAATMLELQPNKRPARSIYELLDELLKDDKREEMQAFRVNLKASVRRLALLGEKMDMEAKTIKGKKIAVKDFEGKFLIIDFFASWCKPCLEETPRLKGHYQKYRSKGLEVIGVSVDQKRESLDKHLKKTKLPWPVIHDLADNPLDTLQIKYGISQLPTVLLINKEGTVVSLEARGAELDRLMQMLFEKPTLAPPKEDLRDDSKK